MDANTRAAGSEDMKTVLLAAAVLLAACHEVPQDAAKSFAPKPATQLYDDALFKGDKQAFEKTLALRAQGQNDYDRIKDGPKK
jgi:hypothetical protein